MYKKNEHGAKGGCTRWRCRRLAALAAVVGAMVSANAKVTAQPVNDECANATTILDGVLVMDSSVGATGVDETGFCAEVDTADVWFIWTAVCNGNVTVSTCGSDYDTTLAVYTGNTGSCGFIPDDVCNNDATGICSPQSQVTFTAFTGTDYLIRIGGVLGATGNYSLLLECPGMGACCTGAGACSDLTQDDCTNLFGGVYQGNGTDCGTNGAACLTGACCESDGACDDTGDISTCITGTYQGDGTTCGTVTCPPPGNDCLSPVVIMTGIAFAGDTTGADGFDESSCAGADDTKDVWHLWSADCTGDVTASLCGSVFDTTLSIFDACPPSTEIACNDDFCGFQSQITFPATQGNDYLIRVAGWGGDEGAYTLLVTCPPTGACCTGTAMCAIQSEGECTANGNVYLGDDTTCEVEGLGCATGACCGQDNTCDDMGDQTACDLVGGRYLGDGSSCAGVSCPPFGTCCTNGVCSEDFQDTCIASGGVFVAAGETCAADTCDGACCDSSGSCSVVSENNCQDSGDLFFGEGSDCADITCPGEGFIPIGYNWNGLVHAGEAGNPDSLPGYRSIADRGLSAGNANSVGGTGFVLDTGNYEYFLETRADVVDTVHLGGPGDQGFDDVIDGDTIGIAPSWDPTGGTDVVASSTGSFPATVPLDSNFGLGVVFNASIGGGTFNMTLGFTDATEVTVTLAAPDWFAPNNPQVGPGGLGVESQSLVPGPLSGGDGFEGTGSTDLAVSAEPLAVVEATVTAASLLNGQGFDVTGKQLNSITFDNWVGASNTTSGNGIYAASLGIPGACCMGPGSCADLLRSACENMGGTFLGRGTDCATDGAACDVGACCFADAPCQENTSPTECAIAGGAFQGNGSICADCPPAGGCCTIGIDGFDCALAFELDCGLLGGTYLGDFTDCNLGCDCNNNSVVDSLEIDASTDCDGNGILDECETPDPSTVGACCIDDACSVTTQGACDGAGGFYFGDCTNCNGVVCPGAGVIPLAYNWNGIVHNGEANMPDAPNGYRSIADRGLTAGNADSAGGTDAAEESPTSSLSYYISPVGAPGLDMVLVGTRAPLNGPTWDDTPDMDNLGVAPIWDPTGGTGTVNSVVTMFPPTDPLDAGFELGVLYDGANGSGAFDMTLGFTNGSSVTVTLDAPDWFAFFNPVPASPAAGVASQVTLPGPLSEGDGFEATAGIDEADVSQPLSVFEARVTAVSLLNAPVPLDVVGLELNSVTFDNYVGGATASVGIYAASMSLPGACSCPGDVSGDTTLDGGDLQPFVDCLLGGGSNCACADVDGMNGVGIDDVDDFVGNLLSGATCP